LKQAKIDYIKQVLNLARNLADFPAIIYFFDDARHLVDQRVAGAGGTIASIISLYNMWGV